MPVFRNCLTCGKEFKTRPSRIKMGWGKYCSLKCRPFEGFKGRTHSIESRQKISKGLIGILKGPNHPRWKGGRKRQFGYIQIRKPTHPFSDSHGYIFEHRLVIEKQIGRYLTSKEVSHHRGKKDDNKPNMLMAFSSQSAHLRFHKNPKNVKPKEIIFDGLKIELSMEP